MIIFKRLAIILLVFCGTANATDHFFTGFSLTASGWTDFETIISSGYSSARVVFVSSSGNDGTAITYDIEDLTFDSNGIFQAPGGVQPYQTLSAAYAQIRDGYPDILLLKRGDSWSEYFDTGSIGQFNKSGPSASARIILASYGASGDRPLLNIGTNVGIRCGGTDNIIVSGIHLYANLWESSTDGKLIDDVGSSSTNQLFEDCEFERDTVLVQGGETAETRNSGIAFRRCIFYNNSDSGIITAMGLAVWGTGSCLLEENISYHPDVQNRHLYTDLGSVTMSDLYLVGNIFCTSARSGLSVRSCGNILDNLIIDNDTIVFGGHGGNGGTIHGGVFSENVIIGQTAGDSTVAIGLYNNDTTTFSDNVILERTLGGSYLSLTPEDVSVARNITISDNVFWDFSSVGLYWPDPVAETSWSAENITISGNDWQAPNNGADYIYSIRDYTNVLSSITASNNRYYSSETTDGWFYPGDDLAGWVSASGETGSSGTEVSYTDPGRTIGDYNQSLGGTATTAAFMTDAIDQARHNWSTNYMAISAINYIRAGFDKDAVSYGYGGNSNTTTVMSGSGAMLWNGTGACVME